MARRMDIELTSSRDDGTWTWRAVGAREPRGVVGEKLLPASAHVGDVLRVEAEFELDGITVTSVLPPRGKQDHPGRIEIASRPAEGSVTTSLVGRSARPDRPDRAGGRSRDGASRDAGPRSPGGPGAGRGVGPRRDGSRPSVRDASRSTNSPTDGARRAGARPAGDATRQRAPTAARPAGARTSHERPRPEASPSPSRTAGAPERVGRPTRVRPQRLVAGTSHRDALLAGLPAEHRAIAEQLATGGLPAVRRALDEQRLAARAAGRGNEPGDAIVTLAEQLLPGVREALWLDRAEATIAALEAVSLRDLRAAVAGGAPRDDQGRALLQQLREALDARVAKLRITWEGDIEHALDEGRVLQALRLSARPPEPTARFPAALVSRLADATRQAMTATTPPERWIALLEAAVASPLRRSVKPEGLPEDKSGAVLQAAQLAVGRVPALAPLLGLSMPPPPRPLPPPPPRGAPRRDTSIHAVSPAKLEPQAAPTPNPHPGPTIESELVGDSAAEPAAMPESSEQLKPESPAESSAQPEREALAESQHVPEAQHAPESPDAPASSDAPAQDETPPITT